MEKYWLKNKEGMMNLRSSVNSLSVANRNEGARMSKRTSSLIVGVVVLVLAMVTLPAAVSIVGTGAGQSVFPGEALARSLALASQPISEAFVRGVALTGQNPVGYVAASGPMIGQSVFPGEALACSLALSSQPISEAFVRSVALTGQNPVGYVAASGPAIGQSVFPGEALASSMALSNQPISEAFVRSMSLSSQAWVDYYGGK
jgi:hypothetical protein